MGNATVLQSSAFRSPTSLANAIRTGQLGTNTAMALSVLGAVHQTFIHKSHDLEYALDLFHSAANPETRQGALKLIADILERDATQLAPIVAKAHGSFLSTVRFASREVFLESVREALGQETDVYHSNNPYYDAKHGICIAPEELVLMEAELRGKGNLRSEAMVVGAEIYGQAAGGLSGPPKGAVGMQAAPMDLSLRLTQELRLAPFPIADIYHAAEKREYNKHGLQFEYAVVKRTEFPYMIYVGSPGVYASGGMLFVMEDFFVDVPPEIRGKLVEMIAVHEYGEHVFKDHHQASLLEFSVARQEGFLEEYLEILKGRYFLKFRDITLYRMEEEPASGEELAQNKTAEEITSGQQAVRLRDSFQWPGELRQRYRAALDNNKELMREKKREWDSYITVNEQVRDYFYKASDEALKVGKTSLGKKDSIEETLLQVRLAFYDVLRPLYQEMLDNTLAKKYLKRDLLAVAVEEANHNLKNGLRLAIYSAIYGDEQQREAIQVVETAYIFARSLEDHFQILKAQAKYLETVGTQVSGDEDEEHADASAKRREENWWRQVGIQISSGKKASEQAAFLAVLRQATATQKVREWCQGLSGSFDGRDYSQSPPSHEIVGWSLEKVLIWQLANLAHANKKLFRSANDIELQAVVDDRVHALGFDTLPIPVHINVTALRQQYGSNLEKYLSPENNPKSLYVRHLVEVYQATEDPHLRNAIVYNLAELYNSTEKVVDRSEKGEIPENLGISILLKIWQKTFLDRPSILDVNGPFPHPMTPFLMSEYGLSPAQVVQVINYKILRDFYQYYKSYHYEAPIYWKALGQAKGLFVESQDGVYTWDDFSALAARMEKQGLQAVQAEIEKEMGTAAVPMEKYVFYAEKLETARANYWNYDTFQVDHDLFEGVRGDRIFFEKELPWILRFVSLHDLVALAKGHYDADLQNDAPHIQRFLEILDSKRRSQGDHVRNTSVTVVDAAFFVRLASEAHVPLADIARNYEVLVSHSENLLRHRVFEQTHVTIGPALDVFTRCGIPLLERASLIELRNGNEEKYGTMKSEEKERYFREIRNTGSREAWERLKQQYQKMASRTLRKGARYYEATDYFWYYIRLEADLGRLFLYSLPPDIAREHFGLWKDVATKLTETWIGRSTLHERTYLLERNYEKIKSMKSEMKELVQRLNAYASTGTHQEEIRQIQGEFSLAYAYLAILAGTIFQDWEAIAGFIERELQIQIDHPKIEPRQGSVFDTIRQKIQRSIDKANKAKGKDG